VGTRRNEYEHVLLLNLDKTAATTSCSVQRSVIWTDYSDCRTTWRVVLQAPQSASATVLRSPHFAKSGICKERKMQEKIKLNLQGKEIARNGIWKEMESVRN